MPRTLPIFGFVLLTAAGGLLSASVRAQPAREAPQNEGSSPSKAKRKDAKLEKAQRKGDEQAAETEAAEPKIGPKARKRARQAYQEGQKHFEAGRYEKALEAFKHAYAAVPNPVVLISIAETQARLGREDQAVEALERYLAEKPEAADRYAIEAKIKSLKTRPATLMIASDPSNARIVIDDEETDERTPTEIEVPPGTHEVELVLAGYKSHTETLELRPGQHQTIDRRLEASTAVAESEVFGEQGAEATSAQAPPATTTNGGADGPGPSTGVWVATGVGGAALVTGTVLGFLALAEESDFDAMPTEETADRGERFALFADVAFGVGAVSLVTALVLHLTESSGEESSETAKAPGLQASPWVSDRGVGVGARGRF